MISRKSKILLPIIGILAFIGICYYISTLYLPSPQPRAYKKIYNYYKIVDINTGNTLMHVSSVPVVKGDELVTQDNKRYVVVRVTGNKAYAKYIETLRIESKGAG
ncbi:MAG: stage II sporulation protein P [Bacillota bacterium]